MICRDAFRLWVSRNLPPFIFLSAYFFTVVLGNIIFAFPIGKELLQKTSAYAVIFQFDTLFSFGFYALLLLPFFVTPLTVMLVRRKMEAYLHKAAKLIPEFRRVDYVLISATCFVYVFFSLWKGDAFTLFSSGSDAISSVEARFRILNQMGFAAQVLLMSLLHYLSIYSLISYMRNRQIFWAAVTVFNIIFMSVLLIILNMKWPILIFYASLILPVFVYSQRKAYLKAIIGSIFLLAVYLLISTFVFRLVPAAPDTPDTQAAETEAMRYNFSTHNISSYLSHGVKIAIERAPELVFAAIRRMAISYPFYYQIFTSEGAVCGGILEQARIGPACRPSTFIYTRIFGEDGFQGRGTSPAAVHISGYALGGWPVALFALICASIILGFFACLPLDMNATVSSLVITGAIAGYHFSQLPGEGPLIYSHGVLWTLLLLFLYIVWHSFLQATPNSAQSEQKLMLDY